MKILSVSLMQRLKDSVMEYDLPFEPIGEDDWKISLLNDYFIRSRNIEYLAKYT